MSINPQPGNMDINAGGLGNVAGSVLSKKQKFGEPKTPFMMKGSPMQRNFGIGSPLKQDSKTPSVFTDEEGAPSRDYKNIVKEVNRQQEVFKQNKGFQDSGPETTKASTKDTIIAKPPK